MRIALLCLDARTPFAGPGAGSRHCRALAEALRRGGHEPVVIVVTPGSEEDCLSLAKAGVEIRTLRTPVTEREIDWHFARARVELVIERLAGNACEGARAAAAAGIPHVYEIGSIPEAGAASADRMEGMACERGGRFLPFEHSHGAIAGSDEVADWARRVAPPGFAVVTISPRPSMGFFVEPDLAQVRAIERQLRLAPDEFRVGFVGRLGPERDLITLIHAVARVVRALPVRLLLVGDGPLRNGLLRAAHEVQLPLTMVGAVEHDSVPHYVALCDAIVAPYTASAEGFAPLQVLEPMAGSRPVVISAIEPVQRMISDGHEALLIPPADVEAMAGALHGLAVDPGRRHRLGGAGRRLAESYLSPDTLVDRLLGFALALPARQA